MSEGKIKKKNKRRNECIYKKGDIPIAIEEVKLGKPLRQIAAKYKIPPTTLHNKINNVSSIYAKSPQTILTIEEKQQVVNWILYSEERGFPITQEQLLNSVKWLVIDLKKDTPFTKNRPGRHWYEAFYRRHPELSKRKPQNLSCSRAFMTEEGLRNPGNFAQNRKLDDAIKPDTDVENKENIQAGKSIPPNVTSPFKRSLLWPPELGPKKKIYKSKNQNMSVATTEEWIYIHEKEAEEKKQKELKIKYRKELAAQKKIENGRKKQELQLKRQAIQEEKAKLKIIKEQEKIKQKTEKILKKKIKKGKIVKSIKKLKN